MHQDYLWTYSPEEDRVYLEDEKGSHPAHFPTHEEMATHVTHPDRRDGYAQRIENGWRITDELGKKIDDPYIQKRVVLALRKEHPSKLVHVLHHGAIKQSDVNMEYWLEDHGITDPVTQLHQEWDQLSIGAKNKIDEIVTEATKQPISASDFTDTTNPQRIAWILRAIRVHKMSW